MKLEDIKVGMKVVPISKSVGIPLERCVTNTTQYNDMRYLVVIKIKGLDGVVECWTDNSNGIFGGDYFLPSDLIPYKEEEGNIKMNKTIKEYLQGKIAINIETAEEFNYIENLLKSKGYKPYGCLRETMVKEYGKNLTVRVDEKVGMYADVNFYKKDTNIPVKPFPVEVLCYPVKSVEGQAVKIKENGVYIFTHSYSKSITKEKIVALMKLNNLHGLIGKVMSIDNIDAAKLISEGTSVKVIKVLDNFDLNLPDDLVLVKGGKCYQTVYGFTSKDSLMETKPKAKPNYTTPKVGQCHYGKDGLWIIKSVGSCYVTAYNIKKDIHRDIDVDNLSLLPITDSKKYNDGDKIYKLPKDIFINKFKNKKDFRIATDGIHDASIFIANQMFENKKVDTINHVGGTHNDSPSFSLEDDLKWTYCSDAVIPYIDLDKVINHLSVNVRENVIAVTLPNLAIGTAVCASNDKFDLDYGIRLAAMRASFK